MERFENPPDVKNILHIASENFEKRQAETNERMNCIREEMDKWRSPQKVKIVLSNKYR